MPTYASPWDAYAATSGGGTPTVAVVYELDFTTDMTTLDVSASDEWPATVDHDIKKGDGTTTKVIMTSSFTTGTEPDVNVDAESSVGITVSVDQNDNPIENMQWAFPIPTTTGAGALVNWDPDKDLTMVEVLFEDVVLGNNGDLILAVLSSGKSYVPSSGASYGWELLRWPNATTSEMKSRRTNTGGSTTKSTGASFSGISGGEDYYVQTIMSRDECLVYADNSTSYQDPRAPTVFTGSCGTFSVSAAQPYAARWGTPYVVILCMKDAGVPTTFNIKKIRVSRWSPGAS